MPEVWRGNVVVNANNKPNHVWATARSTKGWLGVNCTRQENGTRYVNSEFIQLIYNFTRPLGVFCIGLLNWEELILDIKFQFYHIILKIQE